MTNLSERQKQILSLIENNNLKTVKEISPFFNVSDVIIRRELTILAENNLIKRKHGRVDKIESDSIDNRIHSNYETKLKLVSYICENLIKNGDSVFVEGGSTNYLLVKMLAENGFNISLTTASNYIFNNFKDSSINIIFLGGTYQRESDSMIGAITKMSLEHTFFSKAFIGLDGYDLNYGFTGKDLFRVDFINYLLDTKKSENIIIADSSKFNKVYPYQLNPTNINSIITDSKIPANLADKIKEKQKNIKIDIVEV